MKGNELSISANDLGVLWEWMQIRLNSTEDDIEIVMPAAPMRQKGYESDKLFCGGGAEKARCMWMNQTFTQAVLWKADFSEWADCNHFDNARCAPLKYAYNERDTRSKPNFTRK